LKDSDLNNIKEEQNEDMDDGLVQNRDKSQSKFDSNKFK
jgi:hypothetical protein